MIKGEYRVSLVIWYAADGGRSVHLCAGFGGKDVRRFWRERCAHVWAGKMTLHATKEDVRFCAGIVKLCSRCGQKKLERESLQSNTDAAQDMRVPARMGEITRKFHIAAKRKRVKIPTE